MRKLKAVILILGGFILLAVILALPLMILWNMILPSVIGVTKINIFQALGINIIGSILFKSNGGSNEKN